MNTENLIRRYWAVRFNEEEEIRTFTSNSDAFDFWQNESEDIYQDYLKTI